MTDKEKAQVIAVLLYVVFILTIAVGGVVGYIKNVSKFLNTDFNAPYKAEVVRGFGIAIPVIGAVEGYLTINDN